MSPSKAKDKDGKSGSSSRDLSYSNQKAKDHATDLCNLSCYIKNCALSHPSSQNLFAPFQPSTSSTAKASALTVPQTEPVGLTEAPGAVVKGVASSHVNDHEAGEEEEEEEQEEGDGANGSDSSDDDSCSYLEGVDPAMAAYIKELERKDYLHRRAMIFIDAYVHAHLKNDLHEDAQCYDYKSDAFWTGKGCLEVKGVQVGYTKSRVVKDDG